MSDVDNAKRTDRIMNAVVAATLVAAVVVGVILMTTRSGSDEPAVDHQAQAAAVEEREAADRAEAKRAARERAARRARAREAARGRRAMLDGEDSANEKRVLWDWQDDTWFSDEVWRVDVKGGRVTIDSKLDPEPGAEFTARALCSGTLDRYDWARSVRVKYRPPSGAVAARCS